MALAQYRQFFAVHGFEQQLHSASRGSPTAMRQIPQDDGRYVRM
jgi:hypothetical protein